MKTEPCCFAARRFLKQDLGTIMLMPSSRRQKALRLRVPQVRRWFLMISFLPEASASLISLFLFLAKPYRLGTQMTWKGPFHWSIIVALSILIGAFLLKKKRKG